MSVAGICGCIILGFLLLLIALCIISTRNVGNEYYKFKNCVFHDRTDNKCKKLNCNISYNDCELCENFLSRKKFENNNRKNEKRRLKKLRRTAKKERNKL